MAALSSGIAVIQNAALGGALNPSYAALFGSEAALAALVGVTVISSYVRRTGRVSAIVLLLGGVIAAGGCVMLAFGIADIVSGLRGKGAMSLLKFGSICGSDD